MSLSIDIRSSIFRWNMQTQNIVVCASTESTIRRTHRVSLQGDIFDAYNSAKWLKLIVYCSTDTMPNPIAKENIVVGASTQSTIRKTPRLAARWQFWCIKPTRRITMKRLRASVPRLQALFHVTTYPSAKWYLRMRASEIPESRPWPRVDDPARDTSILYRSRLESRHPIDI